MAPKWNPRLRPAKLKTNQRQGWGGGFENLLRVLRASGVYFIIPGVELPGANDQIPSCSAKKRDPKADRGALSRKAWGGEKPIRRPTG